MSLKHSVLLLFAAHLSQTWSASIVTTKNGNIQGIERTVGGEKVYQFLNVPYAKPPLGEYRFKKPEPVESWSDVYNATVHGPSCAQNLAGNDKRFLPNELISEDCLTLNVFVPRSLNASGRSIMVWIHGGGYNVGQANMFDGSHLARTGDVIVITVNYRVGIFGFLKLTTPDYPGNLGLWDQHMAIKWINENAENFGGDPNSITLFGESAGAMAVGIHTLSPYNEGLFQRAICQSGVALNPTAVLESSHVESATLRTGLALGCPDAALNGSKAFLECLDGKSTVEILTALKTLGSATKLSFNPPFGPVVDKDFLPASPDSLYENKASKSYKQFHKLDYLMGNNNAEGLIVYLKIKSYASEFNFEPNVMIPRNILCEKVIKAFADDFYGGKKAVAEAMCKLADLNSNGNNQTLLAVDLYGDVVYVADTIETLNLHSVDSTGNTFQYIFNHEPKYRYLMAEAPWFEGANHADEIFFVFGLDEKGLYPVNTEILPEEKEISSVMMSYWTNFAKTGNPNGGNLTFWPQYGDEKNYLSIGEITTAQKNVYPERMKFLLQTLPDVADDDTGAGRLLAGNTALMLFVLILFALLSS